jgi:glutaconyl-CoA/methylmalonyl-CoA decarboxylase subunit gamma
MKKYTITVNGTAYDVVVEENGSVASAPAAAPAAAPAPTAAPAPVAAPAPAAAPASAGSIEVCSGVAGKVFRIEAPVGTAVKAGDPVVVVEAMKMEIPVVAPQDGTVASIDCAVGDACEAGTLLATLN